jgi:L-threonylcarbamoyladenylate synthase
LAVVARLPSRGVKIRRVGAVVTPQLRDEAAACIASGGTLIFPTDTVYGIGCDPDSETAIAAIFTAKHRPADKPLAIHLASHGDAEYFAQALSRAARRIIETMWPGPIAIVVARRTGRCGAAARGGPTISLRCPDDAVCRELLRATGPLAATSANVSDAPPYLGDESGIASLPDATLAIIAGPTKVRRESTVLDCSSDRVRILRAGAVPTDEIERSLRGVATLEAEPPRRAGR